MTTTYKDILCKNLKINDESIESEREKQIEKYLKDFEQESFLLYCNHDSYYKVTTVSVAEMIEALSKLPPDAKLVMTETGYYSRREFARILLPKPYIVGTNNMGETDLPKGTQVYCIGHSHQTY